MGHGWLRAATAEGDSRGAKRWGKDRTVRAEAGSKGKARTGARRNGSDMTKEVIIYEFY